LDRLLCLREKRIRGRSVENKEKPKNKTHDTEGEAWFVVTEKRIRKEKMRHAPSVKERDALEREMGGGRRDSLATINNVFGP